MLRNYNNKNDLLLRLPIPFHEFKKVSELISPAFLKQAGKQSCGVTADISVIFENDELAQSFFPLVLKWHEYFAQDSMDFHVLRITEPNSFEQIKKLVALDSKFYPIS